MYAVELKNVTKIYRKGLLGKKVPAVTNLSFEICKDRITGFVGPNGAGKTTTIKMLTGLVHPTSGVLLLNGHRTNSASSRHGVAYLSEQPYFYAHLTVNEMLRFTARLINMPSGEIFKEIERVLETVELSHKATSRVKELSKGMQQRLNMAQALLGNPHTLILDEPMSGMDPPGRRLFRELLGRLRDENRTIFFSTHILDDIETTCDDVVVLQQGKLTYTGSVQSLIDKSYTGTEIIASDLSSDLQTTLEKTGCTIRNGINNSCCIVVPPGDDSAIVLKILAGHSIYPQQIARKTMRLEELLYHDKNGEAS